MESNVESNLRIAVMCLMTAQFISILLTLMVIGGRMLYNSVDSYTEAVHRTEDSVVGSLNYEQSVGAAVAYRVLNVYRGKIENVEIKYLDGTSRGYRFTGIEDTDEINWREVVGPLRTEAYRKVKVRAKLNKATSSYVFTIEEVQ